MYKTKEEALQAGERLKKLMRIGQWKVNVWENFGWCYDLVSTTGHLRVCSSYNGKYFTSLSPEPAGVGTPMHLDVGESYDDPNDAVLAQIKQLQEFVGEMATLLYKVIPVLKGKGG